MVKFKRTVSYNSLPDLPPVVELETKEVMRKVIAASRSLARLHGAIYNLPNPMLFIDTIHLQEAKASSEIENIVTTNDELYKAFVSMNKLGDSADKEVLYYKKALWYGLKKLDERPFLTTNLCIEIVQLIKQNSASIRVTPGTRLANVNGEVIYTPPSGEGVLRQKLADWEKFVNEDGPLDPLIKMALMHYQFEAIHPFADGNGRTGRILLLLYLKMEKLLEIPAIFLSGYIIKNKMEYYRRLRAVTEENDWESWILYMLDMIEVTSENGLKRLVNISELMQNVGDEIKRELPNVYSKELIEVLFKLPYAKREILIKAKLGTAKTVGNYLVKLEDKGFLRSVKVGKEKLYQNIRLMRLLENE